MVPSLEYSSPDVQTKGGETQGAKTSGMADCRLGYHSPSLPRFPDHFGVHRRERRQLHLLSGHLACVGVHTGGIFIIAQKAELQHAEPWSTPTGFFLSTSSIGSGMARGGAGVRVRGGRGGRDRRVQLQFSVPFGCGTGGRGLAVLIWQVIVEPVAEGEGRWAACLGE